VVRETANRSSAARGRPRLLPTADRPNDGLPHHSTSDGASGNPWDGRGVRGEHLGRDDRHLRPEDAYRARQEAGLAALVGLASHASLAMADATTLVPLRPRTLDRELSGGQHGVLPGDSAADEGLGRVRLLLNRLRADHLVRNSLYLMVTAGLQAGLGFAFWLVMARLFSPEDVGKASSLISASTILAYFALLGLNATVMRFLPTAQDKGALLTATIVMVSGIACLIAVGYVMLTPIVAPRLAFVAHNPLMTAGFALLTVASAVNIVNDSVFMASRRSELCVVTDGFVGGVGKIVFGILLAGTGAYGLYLAAGGGFAVAAAAGTALIITILRLRPSFTNPLRTLKPLLKFSGANYVASAMTLLPSVVVPLIVLDRLGAKDAGYYFVAFQMASILYAAVAAVESSFMAEGSQAGANWRVIRRRSRRLAVMLFVPGGIVTVVAAHWVLLAFGGGYSLYGTDSLEILAAAVVPIAASNWAWTVLRLTGRLRALVVSTAVFGAAICVGAWVFAPRGLTALSSAWLAGSVLAALLATILAAAARAPARHRRTRRPGTEAGVVQP
jgi:O-antigen/teichoic acid export membrane protein